ncbi:hypothetical protein M8Z33_42120 [Streptomyces sp. ZAF1911]|uniref:hypothetical protein n=1 Tax=Streptomyces sp. ZAF1911 TaxID=2944129 RepID=UPI00237A6375|nr:hypothetical protein [Streptomyces sp. ZAF1911]MDD9383136.1 hypothetical protein [Streptomyces sp. ZAF1911]
MPDELYQRYMEAAAAHRVHASSCSDCTPVERCESGEGLFKAFARFQDAYNARLKPRK